MEKIDEPVPEAHESVGSSHENHGTCLHICTHIYIYTHANNAMTYAHCYTQLHT